MTTNEAAPDYGEMKSHLQQIDEPTLQQIGAQYAQLTEEAQTLVRAEYARRSLEAPLVEDEPAETEGEGGVTVIRQFRDPTEASMARSVLESAGIACFLRDENTVRIDWLWSNLMGGIRLQVADRDVAEAEAILSQPIPATIAMAGQPDFEQPRCPRCESLDISFESMDTKVGATSILLLGFPLPSPINRDYWHCHVCQCNWTDDAVGREAER